ncbi:hypothetical protein EJB05_47612, partial [Eragrostis curvula]
MGYSASAPALLLLLVAGVVAGKAAGHCDIPALAAEVLASCAPAGVPTLSARCCGAVLSAGDGGCICRLSGIKSVADAGLDIFHTYRTCGGVRPLDLDEPCKGSGHGVPATSAGNGSPTAGTDLSVYNATAGVPATQSQHDAGIHAPSPASNNGTNGSGHGVPATSTPAPSSGNGSPAAGTAQSVVNATAGVPATESEHDAGVHAPSPASDIGTNVTAGLGAMKLPSTCNVHLLASTIIEECTDKLSPTDRCCIPVVAAVDIRECLCAVADDSSIIDAGEDWSAKDIMQLYRICGGIRNLPQSVSAACKSEPIPPPSPPTTHESCELKKKDEHIILGFEVTQGVEVLALIAFAVYKVYCKYSKPPQV